MELISVDATRKKKGVPMRGYNSFVHLSVDFGSLWY
jgi:hypothetical protein